MSYEMLGSSPMPSSLRPGCGDFDLSSNPGNSFNNATSYATGSSNYGSTTNYTNGSFPFKPLAMTYTPSRPQISIADQAELEFELRYRGNMIVDQQRKIQQLEEELKRVHDQVDLMNTQITSYEQERNKERKKPQSRYWTPDEHQRFLEALNKFGHKDVKAISMHVSTRNATQVRTHAQKYFLRLERERRKKGDDDGASRDREDDNSSDGDEFSDQSLSPMEEPSPPSVLTPPQTAPQSVPQSAPIRRKRSTSLITPSMGKAAQQHKGSVLSELPSWTAEDYDQFVKGLQAVVEKQDDIPQTCRAIRDGFLLTHTPEDVESCYRVLHKIIKSKPSAPGASSPKRRRTSKPELPINIPSLVGESSMNSASSGASNNASASAMGTSFVAGMSTLSSSPAQFLSTPAGVMPYGNMGMMRPAFLDYNSPPLQLSNMNLGMSLMDVSGSSSPSSAWNPLAFTYELHHNPSSPLSLPQGAPLVSSHN